jgi:[ribosomal protein S5]-alanine N-acetyltransferase
MNLRLKEYKEKDLDRHLELFLMNGICKKITEKIKQNEKTWLKKVMENYEREKPDFYTLSITLNRKLIGNLITEKIDYKNKTLEVGFWIGKDYWNKGYASKALKLFLKKIEKKFNPKKIYAHCRRNNPASGRVLEKQGFRFESEIKGMKTYSKNY